MHVSSLNFKPFYVTISKVPSIAQGISTQVMSFIMILPASVSLFQCRVAYPNFTLTGPRKWNNYVPCVFNVFKQSEKFKVNIPQIKAETASLTPPVIQGILIAPKES